MSFLTTLLGRKVEFNEQSDTIRDDLPGKKGEIVTAVINQAGCLVYHIELDDGSLLTPSLKQYKLLPRDTK